MNFDSLWNDIIKNEGEKFYTVGKKIEFVYSIKDDVIQPTPVNGSKIDKIHKEKIKEIWEKFGVPKTTSQINNDYRAPTYIFAIMNDNRTV